MVRIKRQSKKKGHVIITVIVIIISNITVNAQTKVEPNVTLNSYQKARQVLDYSISAYGGIDSLYAIENFQLRASGKTIQRNQSRRANPPFDTTPYQIEAVVDIKENRIRQTVEGSFPGGFNYRQGLVINENNSYSLDFIEKTFSKGAANFPAFLYYRLHWLPQIALISASERPSQLRYLGKVNFGGKPHEVITFADFDGTQITLFVDFSTKLLSKIEIAISDLTAGDTISELVFPAHKMTNGYKVPIGRIRKVGGQEIERLNFDEINFNSALKNELFEVPSAFQPTSIANKPPVQKITDNIFLINGNSYNVLAVSFSNYILVMEAPGNEAVSRFVIEQIKKTIPDKPIRYLAVTHHHDDHAGGFRAFVAEGASLITTQGNKTYFEKIAKSKFTIQPDSLSKKNIPLKMEFVAKEGKRAFSDGRQTVEIYEIGAGPHAEEMLVAYFPKEKFVYQGDLLNMSASGKPNVNETTVHFANWLKNKGLQIEKIVPVHGTPISFEEFQKVVEKFKAEKKMEAGIKFNEK